jgi:hypothetical protein
VWARTFGNACPYAGRNANRTRPDVRGSFSASYATVARGCTSQSPALREKPHPRQGTRSGIRRRRGASRATPGASAVITPGARNAAGQRHAEAPRTTSTCVPSASTQRVVFDRGMSPGARVCGVATRLRCTAEGAGLRVVVNPSGGAIALRLGSGHASGIRCTTRTQFRGGDARCQLS